MYLIDTNIHVAYLLQNFEDDDLTNKYLELYNGINLADRVIPDFILGEFETFIIQVVPSRYKLNQIDKQDLKQLAFDYLRRLTNDCTLITPDVETVQLARDIYFKNAQTSYLSFVDCLIIATAKQTGYSLFTKDKKICKTADTLNISLYQP